MEGEKEVSKAAPEAEKEEVKNEGESKPDEQVDLFSPFLFVFLTCSPLAQHW